MSHPPNTSELAAGDENALERWFEKEADPLYAFVFFRVGQDAELAYDVVQETLAEALGRLDQFDPERGSMSTWLRMLSRNRIRDALTDRKRYVSLHTFWNSVDHQLERAYADIAGTEFPAELLEREETRTLVSATIATLPVQYREVLTLKYIDELTLEAIASMRETTLDAIKAQLRRARAAFRETFLTLSTTEI